MSRLMAALQYVYSMSRKDDRTKASMTEAFPPGNSITGFCAEIFDHSGGRWNRLGLNPD